MTRIITVTSGKGGVGKTTSTANIGTALALMGNKVCLIDADFGLRNLDIPLGLTNRLIFDLLDYTNGRCNKLEKVLVRDKNLPNLFLLPGNKNASSLKCDPILFEQAITKIRDNGGFDFILIDSSAGIEKSFQISITCADEVIVVTTPDRTAIQDADRVIGLLEEKFPHSTYLVINRYSEEQIKRGVKLSLEEISNTLNCPLLGIILEDEEITKSIHAGKAIALNSSLENGLRFRYLARNLVKNETTPFIYIDDPKQRKKQIPFSLSHYFQKRKIKNSFASSCDGR
jgi:septum site-determining protein MinD